MFASWDEMIDAVATRSGMWVGRPKYSLVRCFLEGFDAGFDDGRSGSVLGDFQQWLSDQDQHSAIKNYVWSSLLLHEVFPERTRVIKPPWQEDSATADPNWPLPSPSPVREDDLTYPGDDAKAIAHLFARLSEFLSLAATPSAVR